MFELDLDAIAQAVGEPRLMANPANVANPVPAPEISQEGPKLAGLATLAISRASRPTAPVPPASPATPPATPPAPTPDRPPPDPDRHCWPHTETMNTAELHALQSHTTRLQSLGLGLDAAERLADQRVVAQRQRDTRRTCLQCRHLSGQDGALYCRNGLQAGIGVRGRVALLSPDWVAALQRCNGFAP